MIITDTSHQRRSFKAFYLLFEARAFSIESSLKKLLADVDLTQNWKQAFRNFKACEFRAILY